MRNVVKLYGIHAVQAALDYSAEKIRRGWIDRQRQDKRLMQIRTALTNLGIVLESSERKQLDQLADSHAHQGVVVEVELPAVRNEEQLKQAVASLTDMALFLVLDQIQDPHNLGACLRTADAAGVHGIIVTRDNACGITPTVCKVASGAAETVPVFLVTNLARTLRWLKQQDIWIMGAGGNSQQSLFETDLNLPLAIVMGSEGKGMRQLTEKHCDFLVRIPMLGQVESLNISVAAGVILYEVLRQRM